jgi:hypothetical protein
MVCAGKTQSGESEMTVVEFGPRLRAKIEQQQFDFRAEESFAADQLLYRAIAQMRETLEDWEVLFLLRNAIVNLENGCQGRDTKP